MQGEIIRTPFEFIEAESELVSGSGFLTEHRAMPFFLFFLAKYGSIVLISALTARALLRRTGTF